MSDQGYTIVIAPLPDEDGGGYIARVPDLQGCMGDGETPEAAARDARSAIGEWLDEAKRLGRDIPAPGVAVEAVFRERHELYATLKEQTKLIKKQEKLLHEARQEVERVQAAAESLMELERSSEGMEHGSTWTVFPALVGQFAVSRRKARLPS